MRRLPACLTSPTTAQSQACGDCPCQDPLQRRLSVSARGVPPKPCTCSCSVRHALAVRERRALCTGPRRRAMHHSLIDLAACSQNTALSTLETGSAGHAVVTARPGAFCANDAPPCCLKLSEAGHHTFLGQAWIVWSGSETSERPDRCGGRWCQLETPATRRGPRLAAICWEHWTRGMTGGWQMLRARTSPHSWPQAHPLHCLKEHREGPSCVLEWF